MKRTRKIIFHKHEMWNDLCTRYHIVSSNDITKAIAKICYNHKVPIKSLKLTDDKYPPCVLKVNCTKEEYTLIMIDIANDDLGIRLDMIKY